MIKFNNIKIIIMVNNRKSSKKCPDDETLKYISLKIQIWQHSNEQSYIDYIERGILLEKMFRL